MKIDRLVKEMDKLVAPLYSKIGDNIIFQKGAPGNIDSTRPRDQGYFRFWDEIKQAKYLGPDYLRSAMDNYLRNKSNKVDDRTRDASYEEAETELFEAIEKRYSELENDLSIFRKKKLEVWLRGCPYTLVRGWRFQAPTPHSTSQPTMRLFLHVHSARCN